MGASHSADGLDFDSCVLLAVTAHQPEGVTVAAGRMAVRLGVPLLCANVDQGRYLTTEHEDGTVESIPLDPELPDPRTEAFESDLAEKIRSRLADAFGEAAPPLMFRQLAGHPSTALCSLAKRFDAELIVVASRRTGLRAGFREFFAGSVAVQLVHAQACPVLVVPAAPGSPPPWAAE